MNNDTIVFIGMDTHKEFTEIAYSGYAREVAIEHFGQIKTTKPAIIKFAKQMQSKYPKATLHFYTKPVPVATGFTAC